MKPNLTIGQLVRIHAKYGNGLAIIRGHFIAVDKNSFTYHVLQCDGRDEYYHESWLTPVGDMEFPLNRVQVRSFPSNNLPTSGKSGVVVTKDISNYPLCWDVLLDDDRRCQFHHGWLQQAIETCTCSLETVAHGCRCGSLEPKEKKSCTS